MVGRASAFADPEIIRLATKEFVPVAGDDWYQRRRTDAEGLFFKKLTDQGPRAGTKAHTHQGMYLFTADGQLLGFKNASQQVDATRQTIRDALAKFRQLPAARTRPGAVSVPEHGPLDPQFARVPPEGGLVASVFTRILDYGPGGYRKGKCEAFGGDKAARDHLWLTADEVKAMAPARAEVGSRYPVPKAVATRLARFHLIDNTRGEPPDWQPDQVRLSRMTLRVAAVTPDGIDLKLDGEVLLATDANPAKADRGFEVRLVGDLRWKPAAGAFDRFDVTAVGTWWGDMHDMQKGRPGRSLLGVTVELAGDRPADRVPPQWARNPAAYFGRE